MSYSDIVSCRQVKLNDKQQNKTTFVYLKWQTLFVSGRDNDKMDAIVQCRGFFYKFGCSGKDYDEAFNLRGQIKKDMKNAYLFLIFLLGPFYLVLSLPTATSNR